MDLLKWGESDGFEPQIQTFTRLSYFEVQSSPAVADSYIYFGSSNYVYCFNAFMGYKVLEYSAIGNIGLNSPALANGTLYITTEGGYVYAFG